MLVSNWAKLSQMHYRYIFGNSLEDTINESMNIERNCHRTF